MDALSLIQAAVADGGINLPQIVQSLTAAGVTGLLLFVIKINSRLTRIETVLLEPDLGLVPRVKGIGSQGHQHANDLQGHEARLDGHDQEIARLDREKEPRRPLGPADVGTMRPT